MTPFRDLDAFKACHEVTLAVNRIVIQFSDQDPELAAQLWAAGVIASSRVARGAGCRSRRLFAACVDRTLGALSEVTCHMDLARELRLVTTKQHQEVESLGGRARFYATKLLASLEADPASGGESNTFR